MDGAPAKRWFAHARSMTRMSKGAMDLNGREPARAGSVDVTVRRPLDSLVRPRRHLPELHPDGSPGLPTGIADRMSCRLATSSRSRHVRLLGAVQTQNDMRPESIMAGVVGLCGAVVARSVVEPVWAPTSRARSYAVVSMPRHCGGSAAGVHQTCGRKLGEIEWRPRYSASAFTRRAPPA